MQRFILKLVLALTVLALCSLYLSALSAQDIQLNETDKLKVQIQVLMNDNASLRKQLAQSQKALSEANVKLAEADERTTNATAPQLLTQIAQAHNIKPEDYEFKIDPQTGEMKFARKPDPPKEAKK